VRGEEHGDPRPQVAPVRRGMIARAVWLVAAGTLALVADAVVGDGASWGDVLLGSLGSGFGVAVAVAALAGKTQDRVQAARPVAPDAVRVWPQPRELAVRGMAGVAFLVAVSVALEAWFTDGVPPGVLWIAIGLGSLAEAVSLRRWERDRGGTLAMVRGPRRSWRARLRRPVVRAQHVLLRPRIDVTLDDHDHDHDYDLAR
jgi:hypothetical protein